MAKRRAPRAKSDHKVALSTIVSVMDLEVVTDGGADLATRMVTSSELNRPGIQWSGYFEHFASDRLQIVGREEAGFLMSIPEDVRWDRLRTHAEMGYPAAIITHNLMILPEFITAANKFAIPLLRTPEPTSRFLSWLNRFLSRELAPRTLIHAGLVDVAGLGVLILGESGMGKSETTMELIRRGHRLVADDTVEVRKPSQHELWATSPEVQRHFMEIKGIGIVDVKRMFGLGAVRMVSEINLVVILEPPRPPGEETGSHPHYDIMGIDVPMMTIPVEPGRNLAVVIEAAAMTQRARDMTRRAFTYTSRRNAEV